MKTIAKKFPLLLCLFLLLSCGGSSGGGNAGGGDDFRGNEIANDPTMITISTGRWGALANPVSQSFETSATANQLGQVGMVEAYARGATGAGVLVGVWDDPVDFIVPDLDGESSGDIPRVENKLSCANCDSEPPTDITEIHHGLWVSLVIAGEIDGGGYIGVAPQARIRTFASGAGTARRYYPPAADFSGAMEDSFGRKLMMDLRSVRDADVINASWTYIGRISDYVGQAGNIKDAFRSFIREVQYAPEGGERRIFVFGAGNAHGRTVCEEPDLDDSENCLRESAPINALSPEVSGGMPYLFPELRGYWLVVAGVGARSVMTNADDTLVETQGAISSFSNRCGVAKSFCLVAPAERFTLPYLGTATISGEMHDGAEDYYSVQATVSGTSFAAPMVAGAAAALISYFPGMSRAEIVQRILTTADKTGIYADDDIYGQGLLDMDAATAPVGEMRLTLQANLAGESRSPGGSTLFGSVALGSRIASRLGSMRIAVFDSLDAPFFAPLSTFYQQAPRPVDLAARLARLKEQSETRQFSTGARAHLLYQFTSGDALKEGGGDSRKLRHVSLSQPLPLSALWSGGGTLRLFLGSGGHSGRDFGLARRFAEDRAFGYTFSNAFSDEDALKNPYLGFAKGGAHFGGSYLMGETEILFGYFTGESLLPLSEELISEDSVSDESLLASQTWRARAAEKSQGALMEVQSAFESLGGLRLSAHTGFLLEGRSFLGGGVSGAFGETAKSTSVFGGVSAGFDFPRGFSVALSGYYGRTQANIVGAGLIDSLSPIESSAFDFVMEKRGVLSNHDRLLFRAGSPLRVHKGAAHITYAEGRRPDKSLDLKTDSLNLSAPPAWRLEAVYKREILREIQNANLAFSLSYEGENADAQDSFTALLSFSKYF